MKSLHAFTRETRAALEAGLAKKVHMHGDETRETVTQKAVNSVETSLQFLADGSYSAVRVYGGFTETAVRLVFPFGDHYTAVADTRKVLVARRARRTDASARSARLVRHGACRLVGHGRSTI